MLKQNIEIVSHFLVEINHTNWVVVVSKTERPKSVRNRHVIEHFDGVAVLSLCLFDFSISTGAFVIWMTQIFSFFSVLIS